MKLLIGVLFLGLVLYLFTLFTSKAPKGGKAMGALANAAIASFLVEAFHKYVGGDLMGMDYLGQLGNIAGGLGGVAAAGLVALALGVSPVYAFVIAVACGNMDLLPGFIAGYLMSFVMLWIEEKFPDGLDLIASIVIVAPLARLLATASTPVVDATLLQIGNIIKDSTHSSPILMGIVLGGIITVVATAPLSSMALTALLGLTGTPMAIGALAVFASSFLNFVLFKKLKFGDRKTTIAVAIEPLSQADIVTANPVPVYVTNFVGGAISGVIIALFGLVNNATGTATPIAGLMVMFGFNNALTVILVALLCAICSGVCGYLGALVFKRYPIVTKAELADDAMPKKIKHYYELKRKYAKSIA
ncbi:PTS sugar transporter subunit IIC [Staphylococcus gallinarum]|uniref:PTS sugar transporter subunit IIC n=1 Tax=Staphylococcus gallinarum TaxID=1293 RepID=UPI000D1C34EA|nr:PTS sugar transporter subunit IIC [Staphylococcus gallinarum]MBU7217046.1 PTS sugar transporter subunit IIC [Staphylococcus gallinarum]MCD8792737.1 PTS sugar transporter subunit IIC [Staphylococcus gallinarum]PTE30103.1 transcriptional regulator [Staphylococcus gallinarum]PTK88500.1 transcriptional regulator [Staphylococcus gallinarum]RIL18790.1 PTS sugar transporter subunit IIC [Staphylococcus gallinarum]